MAVFRPNPAWAHGTGLISLRGPDQPSDPAAEAAIAYRLQDRIHRYCWGFDERREDVLSSCFTQDAVWRAGVMGETVVGPFVGRDQVLRWLTGFWPHQRDQRRHMTLNFIVEEVTDMTATAMCYLILLGSTRAATALETAGMYRLGYRLEGGEWLIASLTAGFDSPFWKQEITEMQPWVRELFGITG
jgi:hypothetical protein